MSIEEYFAHCEDRDAKLEFWDGEPHRKDGLDYAVWWPVPMLPMVLSAEETLRLAVNTHRRIERIGGVARERAAIGHRGRRIAGSFTGQLWRRGDDRIDAVGPDVVVESFDPELLLEPMAVAAPGRLTATRKDLCVYADPTAVLEIEPVVPQEFTDRLAIWSLVPTVREVVLIGRDDRRVRLYSRGTAGDAWTASAPEGDGLVLPSLDATVSIPECFRWL